MIAVFGAGGFIGAYLVDALREQGRYAQGFDIYNQGDVEYTDILDIDGLRMMSWDGITTVVNLVSLQPANDDGSATLADYFMVNTVGLCNILEMCRLHGIKRVMHCTSAKSIAHNGEYSKLTISEWPSTDIGWYYNLKYDMEVMRLRLAPVYGYGPHLEIFKEGKPYKTGFLTFIERARVGKPLEVWGNPDRQRYILYVKDAVSMIIAALNSHEVGTSFVASCRLSLYEEAETIARVFAQELMSPVIFRSDIPNSIEPITDFEEGYYRLGWKPQYDFEAMCRDFIEEEKRGRYKWLVDKRKRVNH